MGLFSLHESPQSLHRHQNTQTCRTCSLSLCQDLALRCMHIKEKQTILLQKYTTELNSKKHEHTNDPGECHIHWTAEWSTYHTYTLFTLRYQSSLELLMSPSLCPLKPWYLTEEWITTLQTQSTTLCKWCVGSFTSPRIMNIEGLWDGAYGFSLFIVY